MKREKFTCLLLIFTIYLTFLAPLSSIKSQVTTDNQTEPKGLQFRLREGSPTIEKRESPTPVPTAKLSEAESKAIFRRLPGLPFETDDKTDFTLRADSLPPPKKGNVINIKFPAAENQNAPTVNTSNTLEILRFAPENNAPLVSDLSVTFSQPIIAVTSQEQAAENAPVKLTPNVKGRWRWLGTTTLIFDAETRFPMATKFTATIPAGTKSALGGTLQRDVSWNFSTSPPKVETFIPKDQTVRRDALILASFNQEINPEAVLPKINAIANNQKIALRLATQAEIEADKNISNAIKTMQPKRFLVFRAVGLLPPDSQITVTFESGLPSAEGELTSTEPQSFSFKTFGALKLDKTYCGYSYYQNEKGCEPSADLKIEFNNPLDEESFDKSLVKISPKIEEAKISVSGDRIEIEGYKKPRTTYQITVSGSLKDAFGQTLGKNISATFKIEPLSAELNGDGQGLITLDPHARPIFTVYSTNYTSFKVKLLSVKPDDFPAYRAFQESDKIITPTFGRVVSDKTINLKFYPDQQIETRIDLSPALKNGFGHALLIVQPTVITEENEDQRIVTWLQKTDIGLDAFADYEQLTVFTSDLKTGQPLNQIEISTSRGANGTTNANGLTEIKLPERKIKPKTTAGEPEQNTETEEIEDFLIARRGADSAILYGQSIDYYDRENIWTQQPQSDGLRWFVFNDRNLYRPGETVSIKGYLRKITGGKLADIAGLTNEVGALEYVLSDSRNNRISKGELKLNAFGAFDLKIQLPKNINLGTQNLEFKAQTGLDNDDFTHNFRVLEFRRPEFEVNAKVESAAPFFVGDSATISVEAKYYAGGSLPNAETRWRLTAEPTNYAPPNRDDFTFGKWIPWWLDEDFRYLLPDYKETEQEFKGVTGTDGQHRLAVDFISANPARPYTIEAATGIQDVNRQTFAAKTNLLVHPAELYVGLRTPKTFVNKGEKFKIETITTDIDGKAAANAPVFIKAELKDWQKVKGEWQNVVIDTQTCQLTSGVDTVSCEITAKQGGDFTITASVLDRRERRNESDLSVWVAGGHSEPKTNVEQENVQLIPDKKEYAPNDVAEILVNAPFFPAEGVLTLRRSGIVKTERFTMNESSTVLRIPIEESWLPNIYAQVDLVGAAQRIVFEDERDAKLPKRPAFANGYLNLNISTASRKLDVTAEPIEKSLMPGGETVIKVAVKDNNGNAVENSEVAVVAVDESILALTDYKINNPLDTFYQEFTAGTNDYHSRENIMLADLSDLIIPQLPQLATTVGPNYSVGSARGNGRGEGFGNGANFTLAEMVNSRGAFVLSSKNEDISGEPPIQLTDDSQKIKIRTNFDALAIFSPSVLTNEFGNAVVKVKLPDNLTRYRITAVAVTKSKQFGLGESAITVGQPLMVRPSAPRFMNFGDRIELPVVLQNQTNNEMKVDLAVRALNANLTDGNGRKLTIPANDRVEIRFPVSAEKAGFARFQMGAVAGQFADAAEIEFPVFTPATAEAFATYGTTDTNGAIVQPILAPNDVYTEFGGLEVTTSSTQLQELTDAFIYLQSYPFECTEQISSRILSVAALRDVLTAFEAKDLPSKEQIEAKMNSDIARLVKLQHKDGGFSFWRSDDESIPFVSIHVAHALARAKAKGYPVPNEAIAKSLTHLRNIGSHYKRSYSRESWWAIEAYTLYVRDLMNDKDTDEAKQILREAGDLENLSPETLGWLLSVLADDKNSAAQVEAIKRHLFGRVTETSDKAHFVTNYTDGEYVLLSSDRRADGVILEALLKSEPSASAGGLKANELIPKIVRGLLANKTQGRWATTQENVFILLALDKYFQTYEKVTPDFVAKVWLGNAYAGEQNFRGRSTDANLINVPMNYLQQQNGAADLILDKQGAGRLYYRIGMKYAPKNLKLEAADYGFNVTRRYEAVDDAKDVKRNADGSWTIKSGARVRVKIQMVAPASRYHVALVDRLPAGLEIINPELAVSEKVDEEPPVYRRSWFSHQNLRDDRAEAFTTYLYAGVWQYSYVARATTPGNFVAPPAKAEEMYSPETFGRSMTEFVKVE